jgi:predicted DNA-binding antitoxin AbrB/MazE fold protein
MFDAQGRGKGFLSLKANLILVMHMRMKAIYKDAVLKPLTKLDLKEGDVVVIDLKKISMRDFHGKVEIEKQIADDIIEMEIWD